MIYIDRREGSANMVAYLPDDEIELVELESGDAAIDIHESWGEGQVGVEVKRVHDAVHSMVDGRLNTQVERMLRTYRHNYLVIELPYQEGVDGILEASIGFKWKPADRRKSNPMTLREFEGRLISIEMATGGRLSIRQTRGRRETALLVYYLHHWWNLSKESHQSFLTEDTSDMKTSPLVKLSVIRQVAMKLPGIGYERSADVVRHFGSIKRMINSGIEEWMKIPRIGPEIANRVVTVLKKDFGPTRGKTGGAALRHTITKSTNSTKRRAKSATRRK